MAEVSYLLNLHGDDEDERGDVLISLDSLPNWSQDFDDGFDVFTSFSDPDFVVPISSVSHQSRSRLFTDNVSVTNPPDIFDRRNQVNFVMDLFNERVDQSSLERIGSSNTFEVDLDLGLGLPGIGRRDHSNRFEVDLDLGLGLGPTGVIGVTDDEIDDMAGFMVADAGEEDFFVSRRTRNSASVLTSGAAPLTVSGGPDYFMSGLGVVDIESDSDYGDSGIEEGFDDENVCHDDDDEDDASLRACWDAFQLADGDNIRVDSNEDFEWEEVDGGIEERDVFGMLFDGDTDDDASVFPGVTLAEELRVPRVEGLEWEFLLNVHNLDSNSELGHDGEPYDEYNYADHEMFFGHFADNENASMGHPPASKVAIGNLLSVAITRDDVEKNNAICAVCKDELNAGQMAKQLPCCHRYHGECIVPWLGIRNTCPVCRYELPTDDPAYERRRAEIAVRTN